MAARDIVSPRERGHQFPGLDVLRGLAILLVLVHHLPENLQPPFGLLAQMGGRGVDLFFGLSGFLIGYTTLLRARSHGFAPLSQIRSFLILRMGRIMPMYSAVLLFLAAGVVPLWATVTSTLRAHPLPYLVFAANTFFQESLELGVLWSLAIEEQFYLFVAFALIFFGRSERSLGRLGALTAGASILISNAYRWYLDFRLAHQDIEQSLYVVRYFFATPSRIDQLAVGLFIGLNLPWLTDRFRFLAASIPAKWVTTVRFSLFILVVAAAILLPYRGSGWPFVLTCLFAFAIFSLTVIDSMHAIRRTLPETCLAFVGKVSFSLYLLHPFFRTWLSTTLPPDVASHGWGFLLIWVGASTAGAYLTYRLIESPSILVAKRVQKAITGQSSSRASIPA